MERCTHIGLIGPGGSCCKLQVCSKLITVEREDSSGSRAVGPVDRVLAIYKYLQTQKC